MTSGDIEEALYCLKRASKDIHIRAKQAFFSSRPSSYGELIKIKSTIDSCILLLSNINSKGPLLTHEEGDAPLVG